jgi:hypothetical protein
MRHVLIAAFFSVPGVLVSCGRKETPAPPRVHTHVLAYVPKLRGSIVVDTSGTDEAERLTMVIPVSGDSVARFYRSVLPPIGWRIRSDVDDSALTDIYAEGPQGGRDGPTLWIHIEHQDTLSARYTLIASFPAALREAKPGSARRDSTPLR